jgi:hypothetical protein
MPSCFDDVIEWETGDGDRMRERIEVKVSSEAETVKYANQDRD